MEPMTSEERTELEEAVAKRLADPASRRTLAEYQEHLDEVALRRWGRAQLPDSPEVALLLMQADLQAAKDRNARIESHYVKIEEILTSGVEEECRRIQERWNG